MEKSNKEKAIAEQGDVVGLIPPQEEGKIKMESFKK